LYIRKRTRTPAESEKRRKKLEKLDLIAKSARNWVETKNGGLKIDVILTL